MSPVSLDAGLFLCLVMFREEYIYCYNNERLQLKINKLLPSKYLEQLYTA